MGRAEQRRSGSLTAIQSDARSIGEELQDEVTSTNKPPPQASHHHEG
jgi:hypothetical protein